MRQEVSFSKLKLTNNKGSNNNQSQVSTSHSAPAGGAAERPKASFVYFVCFGFFIEIFTLEVLFLCFGRTVDGKAFVSRFRLIALV